MYMYICICHYLSTHISVVDMTVIVVALLDAVVHTPVQTSHTLMLWGHFD